MTDPAALRRYTRGALRARWAYAEDPFAATNAHLQADRDAASRRMRRLRAKTKETQ